MARGGGQEGKLAATKSAFRATRPPIRLLLAHGAARLLPLTAAHLLCGRIYPFQRAIRDGIEYRRRALTGSTLSTNAADEIGYFFALRGCYDWKIWAVARAVCKTGDVVVEVGANVGTETIGLADMVGPQGHVYSFEPVPANLARLRAAISLRAEINVTVEPSAVSDSVGTVDFVIPANSRNSGTGHIDSTREGDSSAAPRVQAQATTRVQVQTTTLDEYFRRNAKARLLTIDVEGAELMVLRGGQAWIQRNRPIIVLEAHHRRQELYDFLRSMDFVVRSIERFGLRPPKTDEKEEQWNWLAVHSSEVNVLGRVNRMIQVCGIVPPLPFIHPLVGSARF